METHKGRRFIPSPDTKIQSITAGSGGTPVVQALVRIMCLRPGYVMRNCLIKGGGGRGGGRNTALKLYLEGSFGTLLFTVTIKNTSNKSKKQVGETTTTQLQPVEGNSQQRTPTIQQTNQQANINLYGAGFNPRSSALSSSLCNTRAHLKHAGKQLKETSQRKYTDNPCMKRCPVPSVAREIQSNNTI